MLTLSTLVGNVAYVHIAGRGNSALVTLKQRALAQPAFGKDPMEIIVQLIYFPSLQVTRNPAYAFVVAFGFAGLLVISLVRGGKIRPWTHASCLLACALWVAFGMHEYRMREIRNPIRVDLLVLWPPLLLLSLAMAWQGMKSLRNCKPATKSEGPKQDLQGV